MRWNMVLGALVISVGLCSQSFGFELLDRMLGLDGGYGCGHEAACCEPACDVEPASGCDSCETACSEPEPCCEQQCGGHGHGHGLLDGLFGHGGHKSCGSSCDSCESACDTCEPACGSDLHAACGGCDSCEPACGVETSCCEPEPCSKKRCRRHGNLLGGLFGGHRGHGHHHGCSSCGGCDSCGGGASSVIDAPADSGDAAPMPPAPMADPSASLRSRRRVRTTSFASR